MSVDSIGDFLTIIRNGVMASKTQVVAPYSRARESIAQILSVEGFIRDYGIEGEGVEKRIIIYLKYVDNESVIHKIERISKPGRRVYAGANKLPHVIGGLGIAIVSTSRGIVTNKQARQQNIGGEVMCSVW